MASLGSFQPRSFTSSSWSSCTRPTFSVGEVASAWLAVGPSCSVCAVSCLEGLFMVSVSGAGTKSWYATPELSAMAVYGSDCRRVVGSRGCDASKGT
jgi:hypothetical protein